MFEDQLAHGGGPFVDELSRILCAAVGRSEDASRSLDDKMIEQPGIPFPQL
jgi:hypothetical protein